MNTENVRKKAIIASSERLISSALRSLLENNLELDVVGEVISVYEALNLLAKTPVDLVITESVLADQNIISLLHKVREQHFNVPVVVIAGKESSPLVLQQARANGVGAIVYKQQPLEILKMAVNVVLAGKHYYADTVFTQPLASQIMTVVIPDEQDPLWALSKREREIFGLLAHGLQNSKIAIKLSISPRTVETHRARIVKKLHVNSNAELILFAVRNGLTTL
ncbi:MAG: response regulator transcription factor [Deltaproteobacteria bacterium]|nr:response regulator transcription factor [Deltaproteobacteria bacterium]